MSAKISRRKFLYAGTGLVAAASVGYLTKDYWSPLIQDLTTQPEHSPSPIQTLTPEPIVTSTTTKTFEKIDLELLLFHDYHGDGAKQDDEPVIQDASFDVFDDNGNRILDRIRGNGNGIYRLDDLIDGIEYEVIFSKDTLRKYRYLSISNKEFRENSDYKFIANSNMPEISLGLMEGFLTLPIRDGTNWEFQETSFYDHGGPPFIKDGKIRDWKGGNQTYDGHAGTDFYMSNGQLIVAAAPGTTILTEDGWHTSFSKLNNYHRKHGNRIMIYHDNGMKTYYCHLDDGLFVKTKERVKRGQLIAFSDRSGTLVKRQPHLHFGVYIGSSVVEWGFNSDPYGDIENPNSKSLWTKDNDPQYPNPD
ncbi:MAG: M23 family metallopeptidase [Candidatus Bathyarchaeota archaeon]|nr:M23 family metallopeptidase [Candidatus Bathyarchaeota archaeon]